MLNKIITGSAALMLQMIANSMVLLLIIPHITKIIGIAEYGRLAISLSVASYAMIFVQYSFNLIGPRQLAEVSAESSERQIFNNILKTKLFLLAFYVFILGLVFTLSIVIDKKISFEELIILILMPIGATFNCSWFLQFRSLYLYIVFSSIIAVTITLGIGFLSINETQTSSVILFSALTLTTTQLVTGFMTYFFSLMKLRAQSKGLKSKLVREQITEGWPLFASQAISTIYMLAGTLVVGYISGAEAAGVYSIIEKIINPLIAICLLIHTAAYPVLTVAFQKNEKEFWFISKKVVLVYFIEVAIISILLIAAQNQILSYFLVGAYPKWVSSLLIWSVIFMAASIIGPLLTSYLYLSGCSRQIILINSSVAIAVLIFGIPAVYYIGPTGWMASLALSQGVVILYAFRAKRIKTVNLLKRK